MGRRSSVREIRPEITDAPVSGYTREDPIPPSALALFDPASTVPQTCQACGATRQPDEQRAPACAADRDHERRPHQCLNRIDNATTPWPDGY